MALERKDRLRAHGEDVVVKVDLRLAGTGRDASMMGVEVLLANFVLPFAFFFKLSSLLCDDMMTECDKTQSQISP